MALFLPIGTARGCHCRHRPHGAGRSAPGDRSASQRYLPLGQTRRRAPNALDCAIPRRTTLPHVTGQRDPPQAACPDAHDASDWRTPLPVFPAAPSTGRASRGGAQRRHLKFGPRKGLRLSVTDWAEWRRREPDRAGETRVRPE